jgi:hypothetical protein
MPQIIVNEEEHKLEVPVLLTAVSGKVRIKNRSILNDYGVPVAAKQDGFKLSNYIEWQIGYDVVKTEKEKLADSTLQDTSFIGANRKEKALYELSEYVYYFYKWGIITSEQLQEVADYLKEILEDDLLDMNPQLRISRDELVAKKINGFDFEYTLVKYPLLLHKFGKYEIITEIKITEKQRAVGIMPMLYLCFPITELKAEPALIGRVAETKEIAYFNITEENIKVFVEILKMFGTLSANHKHDVLQIIDTILNS